MASQTQRSTVEDFQVQNARYEKLLDRMGNWTALAGAMLAVAVVLSQIVFHLRPQQELPARYSIAIGQK